MKYVEKDPLFKDRYNIYEEGEYGHHSDFIDKILIIIVLICVIVILAMIVYDIFIK